MYNAILAINAGASGIRFGGYTEAGADEPDLLGKGQIEGISTENSAVGAFMIPANKERMIAIHSLRVPGERKETHD